MILDRLVLKNFRTYGELDISFGEGLNLILGDNAVGKTNLAEAIQYISLARSWRSSSDRVLIKAGADMALIQAHLKEGALRRSIEIEIAKEGKRVKINGKPVNRLSELSKSANVIVFAPSDVPLFAGAPSERRAFLDVSISKQSPDYFSLMSKYARLLKSRNAALKQAHPDVALLRTYSDQMSELTIPIIRYRTMFVSSLNHVLPSVYGQLSGQQSRCEVVYRPFLKGADISPEKAKKAFEEALESDLVHRATGVGVHREDISLMLNGENIANYGSQGENRTAVIAVKLSPYFLIEDESKKPIAVLDDVNSELDSGRVERLMGLLEKLGQVFVTATKLDIAGASVIDVAEHSATRRI